MNFGTDGYGTDQVYLQYLQEGVPLDPDIIFYVYCDNDLRNINENDLFRLDKNGNLIAKHVARNGFIAFINRFYTTYLIVDSKKHLRNMLSDKYMKNKHAKRFHDPNFFAIENDFLNGNITEGVDKTLKTYFAILSQIRSVAEENRAKFYIATLPSSSSDNMADLLKKNGYEVLNLRDKFSGIHEGASLHFKNDGHWNEEGNKLAAMFLFKFIADKLSLEYSGDGFIEQSLYEYYSSFKPYKVTDFFMQKHSDLPADLNDNIRSRYLALEKPK
jgi:hypothetical protein